MRVHDLLKIDFELIDIQKNLSIIFIIILLIFVEIKPNMFGKKFKLDDLKVDINRANLNQLIKVPYIGQKTGSLIIEIRKSKGYFKSVEEINFLTNFDKFKKYIKVEE